MGVRRVIQLTEPLVLSPPIPILAIGPISADPFTKRLTYTVYEVDAKGERITGGAAFQRTVSGAKYDAFVAPLLEPVIDAAVADLIGDGTIKGGAIVDAQK